MGFFEPKFGSKNPKRDFAPFPKWEGGWGIGKNSTLKQIIREQSQILNYFNLPDIEQPGGFSMHSSFVFAQACFV
jgi:hypothetical protein